MTSSAIQINSKVHNVGVPASLSISNRILDPLRFILAITLVYAS